MILLCHWQRAELLLLLWPYKVLKLFREPALDRPQRTVISIAICIQILNACYCSSLHKSCLGSSTFIVIFIQLALSVINAWSLMYDIIYRKGVCCHQRFRWIRRCTESIHIFRVFLLSGARVRSNPLIIPGSHFILIRSCAWVFSLVKYASIVYCSFGSGIIIKLSWVRTESI